MRYTPIVLGLMMTGAFAGPQQYVGPTQYANPEVVVHPVPGENVLLYPGGNYGRIVKPGLLEPGEKAGPVKLRKPTRHAARKAAAPAVGAAERKVAAPVRTAAKPKADKPAAPAAERQVASRIPAHKSKTRTAKPKTKPSLADDTSLTMNDLVVAKPKPGTKIRRVQHKRTSPEELRVAKAEPAPKTTPRADKPASKSGHNVILFERNASGPGSKSMAEINRVAKILNSGLGSRGRVQIMAYAGRKGDKSSAARRLSLKRAIIVRQLLIDDGIPSDRIDVRAMGGISDNGPAERVDIFLKG